MSVKNQIAISRQLPVTLKQCIYFMMTNDARNSEIRKKCNNIVYNCYLFIYFLNKQAYEVENISFI